MPESASFEQRLAHLRSLAARQPSVPRVGADLTEQRQRLERARAQVVARLRDAMDVGEPGRIEELRARALQLAQKIAFVSEASRSSPAPSDAVTDSELRAQIVVFLAWAREQQAALSADDRAELQAVAANLVRKRRESLMSVESSLQAARKHALQGVVLIRELRSMVDALRDGDVVTGVRRLPFEPQRHLAANQFGLSSQAVTSAIWALQTLSAQWPELRAFAALPDWSALPFDEIVSVVMPSDDLSSPVEATRLAMLQRLRMVDDLGAATVLWLSELLGQTAALPGPGSGGAIGPERVPVDS